MKYLLTSNEIVFGLAFDIEKDKDTKSRYRPAQRDLASNKELFAHIRLEAFANLLRHKVTSKLIVVGGNEQRYGKEISPINRGWAICEMLIHDFNINPEQVGYLVSTGNTAGNITAIKKYVKKNKISKYFIVSNFYHLPRINAELILRKSPTITLPAESFWLLDKSNSVKKLATLLGNGSLAQRIVKESQGIIQKISRTYKQTIT